MPIHNAEIADLFDRYATLLEIEEANAFRIRAYRNAARTIRDLPRSLSSMLEQGENLSALPAIGKDLEAKIQAIVDTGHFHALAELSTKVPGELADLTALPGLGPKRVKVLYQELGVKNIDDLKRAARAGKVSELAGFGNKTEAKLLTEIEHYGGTEKRFKLIVAEEYAEAVTDYLKALDGIRQVTVAGSYRRRKETVGDLDILVSCKRNTDVIEHFVAYEDVAEIISKGNTRSTVILRSGLQVDLRVVPQISYGAALHYFTGSKDHNIALRKIAVKRGWKLNEYGLFKGEQRIAGRTEEDVYAKFKLSYIEPELRENRGEIEAAKKGKLPKLIKFGDIRGDLHSHTRATDGTATLEEMAGAANKRGYDYLAISDHTQHLTVARGLDPKRLARQIRDIDRINQKLQGIVVLKAAEVDILEDGSLDLPDDILKQLDLTVCSIHYKFDLPATKQTDRIIRAMDNPYFNILGHPTGRLIDSRGPYALNMERLMTAARDRGCYLELNAQPDRLDLSDVHCKMAKELGLKVAISSDAHSTASLDYMRFGVYQARRGWLEPADVLNTCTLNELGKRLRRG